MSPPNGYPPAGYGIGCAVHDLNVLPQCKVPGGYLTYEEETSYLTEDYKKLSVHESRGYDPAYTKSHLANAVYCDKRWTYTNCSYEFARQSMFYPGSGLCYSYEACRETDFFTKPCLCTTFDGKYLPGETTAYWFPGNSTQSPSDTNFRGPAEPFSSCMSSGSLFRWPSADQVTTVAKRGLHVVQPACWVQSTCTAVQKMEMNYFTTTGHYLSFSNCGSINGIFEKLTNRLRTRVVTDRTQLGYAYYNGYDAASPFHFYRESELPPRSFPSPETAAKIAIRTENTGILDVCVRACSGMYARYKSPAEPSVDFDCRAFVYLPDNSSCHLLGIDFEDAVRRIGEPPIASSPYTPSFSIRGLMINEFRRYSGDHLLRGAAFDDLQSYRTDAVYRAVSLQISDATAASATGAIVKLKKDLLSAALTELNKDSVNEKEVFVYRDEYAILILKFIGIIQGSFQLFSPRQVLPSAYASYGPRVSLDLPTRSNADTFSFCPREESEITNYREQEQTERSLIVLNGSHIFVAVAQTLDEGTAINFEVHDGAGKLCPLPADPQGKMRGKAHCGYLKEAFRLLWATHTTNPSPNGYSGDVCRILFDGMKCVAPVRLVVGGMTQGAAVAMLYVMLLDWTIRNNYGGDGIDARRLDVRLWMPLQAGDRDFVDAYEARFGTSTQLVGHIADAFTVGISPLQLQSVLFESTSPLVTTDALLITSSGSCHGTFDACAPRCTLKVEDAAGCLIELLSAVGPLGTAHLAPIDASGYIPAEFAKEKGTSTLSLIANIAENVYENAVGALGDLFGTDTRKNKDDFPTDCYARSAFLDMWAGRFCAGVKSIDLPLASQKIVESHMRNYAYVWHWCINQRAVIRGRRDAGTLSPSDAAAALSAWDGVCCETARDETPVSNLESFTLTFGGKNVYDRVENEFNFVSKSFDCVEEGEFATVNGIDSYGDGWDVGQISLFDESGIEVAAGITFSGFGGEAKVCAAGARCITAKMTVASAYMSEISFFISFAGKTSETVEATGEATICAT